MPVRIQRSRAAGWRKPQGAVIVTRPSFFGNPFRVDKYGQDGAVDLYDRWLAGELSAETLRRTFVDTSEAMSSLRHRILTHLFVLRGHDLCCWCAADQPCHADVLLRLANA